MEHVESPFLDHPADLGAINTRPASLLAEQQRKPWKGTSQSVNSGWR